MTHPTCLPVTWLGARDLYEPLCAQMPFVSFPLLGCTCDHCHLGTGSSGPLCPYLESPALEQRFPELQKLTPLVSLEV